MIVKDLFYNLPVREKFLDSDLVETNHVTDIIYKIILGNSESSIKFIKDNKIILKTSRNNNMRDHIYSILGKDFSKDLITMKNENPDLKIKGYFSNNNLYRANRSHQYIYINNRYIVNKNITNIIEKNYRSIIPLNRFPIFVLFIDIDPSVIDVNIHPTKQEVSFVNQMELIEEIDELLKEHLYNSISIPEMLFKEEKISHNKENLPLLYENEANIQKNTEVEEDILIKDFTEDKNSNYEYTSETGFDNFGKQYKKQYKKQWDEDLINNEDLQIKMSDRLKDKDTIVKEDNDINAILSKLQPMGVIFNTYILGEDKENERIYFIDQHAAHERIMYEKYLEEYEDENIVSQQLISSEIINLTNIEMNKFLENMEIFNALGFDVSEFGANSVAIRSVPLIFGQPDIKSLFYDILDNLDNKIKSSYDTRIDKIMKMSCVNAIKGGDRMSEIEILSLFDQLKKTKNPNSCPHGRPTILEMSKKDIEKAFLRIL